MNPTRDSIIENLRSHGELTVAELADEIGISPASVRHHLTALQAQGWAHSQEVRQNVGRPHLSYSLTEAAQEHFPARYIRLSDRLLDEMKARLPPETISQIFTDMASGIAASHSRAIVGKSLEEKLPILVDLLGAEGFMAEWDRVGERYRLTQNNCPYFRIGRRHPEVCLIDQTLISEFLSLPVQKGSCLLDGDARCTFTFPQEATSERLRQT